MKEAVGQTNLLQEVNELIFSDLSPELPRLSHSQEYCFDLLGPFRTDKRDTSNWNERLSKRSTGHL
jgi:hypothetical protein